MGHPAQMAKELPNVLPGIFIHEWVYGLFNTTIANHLSGVKGLLAATETEMVFYTKQEADSFATFSFFYKDIESVDADLEAPARITCYLNNGMNFDLSFISRGDAHAFMRYVTVHGHLLQKNTI